MEKFSLEDAVLPCVRKPGILDEDWVCTHRLIVNAPEKGGWGRGKEEGDGIFY